MSLLTYDSDGIQIPETSAVRADLVSKIQAAFQTGDDAGTVLNCDPATPMGQVVDALTAELEAVYAAFAFAVNQYSRKTSAGKFLDALASLYFLERKVSEPTLVQCTCTGLKGTVIPFGAEVVDTNGNRFRCMTPAGVTIGDDGTALVEFAAVEHGALQVQPETVTKIVTTIAGWDSVTNPAAGVVGRLEESDAELRDRMYQSVAMNAHGTLEALQSSILAIDGVIDCRVLENYGSDAQTVNGIEIPGHSIAVCVSGGDDTEIAETIYKKKDAGCGMTGTTTVTYADSSFSGAQYTYPIVRPTNTNLYIQVTFFATAVSDTIKEAVVDAIVDDANGNGANTRIGLGERVYGSRFWSCVLAQTTTPIASIKLALGSASGWADYVDINADIEPVVADATVVIEVQS